jgi:hypothetical protein
MLKMGVFKTDATAWRSASLRSGDDIGTGTTGLFVLDVDKEITPV